YNGNCRAASKSNTPAPMTGQIHLFFFFTTTQRYPKHRHISLLANRIRSGAPQPLKKLRTELSLDTFAKPWENFGHSLRGG
ncbi:MAG: hypothetical protein WAP18_00050, partial [Bacteroidales bacterium]